MSSSVNINGNVATNVTPSQTAGPSFSSSSANQSVKADSEIIAQVVSVEIKPSNINQTIQPTREAIEKAAADLQQFVQAMGRDLSFSVDSITGYHVVRVTNPATGETVRQLPSAELLRLAQSFEQMNAALVNQRA